MNNYKSDGPKNKGPIDKDDLTKIDKRLFTRRPPIYKALLFRDDEESSKEDYDAMYAFINRDDSVFKGKVESYVGNPDAVKAYLEDL